MLRVSNIRTGEVEGNLVYISDEKQEQLKRSKVYPNDVLLTKAGAVLGYSAVFPESLREGNITSHLVTITCRDGIDPHYLSHFFRSNVGQLQIYRWGNKSTRPELNTSEVESILVTTPPPDVQFKIVERLNAAYTAKKQKEEESQRLLDSIDDYLLSELGINLPEPEENIIQNRVFYCNLRSVVGRRFDPLYYSGNIYKFIESSSYSFEYISRLTVYMKTGFASGKQDQSNDEQDVIQIRSTNISDEREFIFARNVYIHKSELLNRKNDVLQLGEVLFNNTNSQELVGKSIFFDLENSYFCSNHTTRIGIQQDKVDPQYLTHVLNLYQRKQVFFKICTNWNNQSGVNVNVLGQVKTPIPPLEKQLEIVDRITAIRTQAKQLRQAAAAELEQAKQEVEAMILGES